MTAITVSRDATEGTTNRRDLVRGRSLSRRVLRTMEEMIEEASDCSNGEIYHCEEDDHPQYNVEQSQAHGGNTSQDDHEDPIHHPTTTTATSTSNSEEPCRRKSLKKTLSKRVIQTMVKLVDKTAEELTDEETDDDIEDIEDFDDERSILLTQGVSKRLVDTFSEVFDDESLNASLEIFGDLGNKSAASYELDLEIQKDLHSSKSINGDSKDGFEKFMMSLKNDESFHNSLNGWLGSLSDVFDRTTKTSTSGGLTKKDYEAMDRNTKRMNQVGQYLRQTLKSKNLIPTQEEVDAVALSRIRRKKALQSEAQISSHGLDEPVSASPTLLPNCRNISEEDMDICFEANESNSVAQTTNAAQPVRIVSPLKTSPKGIVHMDTLSIARATDAFNASKIEEGKSSQSIFSTQSTLSGSGNAARPVRLPSPVKSPRQIGGSGNAGTRLPFALDLSSM